MKPGVDVVELRIERIRRLQFTDGTNCGSEKEVWEAKLDGKKCVLCYPLVQFSTELERELSILRQLQECDNIVQLIEDFPAQCCIALQIVEPLGYDLMQHIQQTVARGRPLPLAQITLFVDQLATAISFMAAKKVVHCDLKPDNVLLTPAGKVVIIDFGFAHAPWVQPRYFDRRWGPPCYAAPETVFEITPTPAVDAWGLGYIIYVLSVGATVKDFRYTILRELYGQRFHGTRLAFDGVRFEVVDVLRGLLVEFPAHRWGADGDYTRVKQWAADALERTITPENKRVLAKTSCGELMAGVATFKRWAYSESLPVVFGAQIPIPWASTGQTIGKLFEGLGFGGNGGFQILLVDNSNSDWDESNVVDELGKVRKAYRNRRDPSKGQWKKPDDYTRRMEPVPGQNTILNQGDIIWLGFEGDEKDIDTDKLGKALEALGLMSIMNGGTFDPLQCHARAANRSQESFFRVIPTFLYFKVPTHLNNAALGPSKKDRIGTNALNVRNAFGVSIVGISTSPDTGEVKWLPGGKTILKAGSQALVMTVPEWNGASPDLLPEVADNINMLLDPERLRDVLKLSGEAWEEWKRNAGMDESSRDGGSPFKYEPVPRDAALTRQ